VNYLNSILKDIQSSEQTIVTQKLSGLLQLDKILGGGLEPGITEISGEHSSGKTSLAYSMLKQNKGIDLIVDCDHSVYLPRLKQTGCEHSLVCQINEIQKIFDTIKEASQNGCDIIVLDSIASVLMSNSDIELMSEILRKIVPILKQNNTCLIMVNHFNKKIAGGKSLAFYQSCKIRLDHIGYIRRDYDIVGITSKATILKSKAIDPFSSCEIAIYFSSGVSRAYDTLQTMINQNTIQQRGSWYWYKGEAVAQGINSMIEFMELKF
jgi:RecA/RadA recombinase